MVRGLILAWLLVVSQAWADRPAEPESTEPDPRIAIKERGIVLRAGKQHFLVIVPAPGESALHTQGKVYFGTAKALTSYGVNSYTASGTSDWEERGLADDRNLHASFVERTGSRYEIVCTPQWEGESKGKPRKIALTAGTFQDIARAGIFQRPSLYTASLLGRVPKTTTYLYMDARDGKEHRVFMGKRGAMKALKVKEAVDDPSSTVIVTTKGTLTIVPGKTSNDAPTVTFGSEKKPVTLEPLSVHTQKRLIYFDLGVYTHEKSGHPCDEL